MKSVYKVGQTFFFSNYLSPTPFETFQYSKIITNYFEFDLLFNRLINDASKLGNCFFFQAKSIEIYQSWTRNLTLKRILTSLDPRLFAKKLRKWSVMTLPSYLSPSKIDLKSKTCRKSSETSHITLQWVKLGGGKLSG